MANRPILDIEVNDSEFTEFLKKWEDYKTQAAAMPQSWMSVNYEIANLKTRFEKILQTLEGQNRKTEEAIDSQSKFAKIFDAADVTVVSIGTSGKRFAHNIHQSTQSLMKWTKLTSVFSGLLGAGGLYGIDRMAAGAASRRTEATGLGVSIGEQSAFEAAFGRLGNPGGVLSGFSEGLATPVGRAQIGHLLGHAPTGDAAETAIEALPKFKEFLAHTEHDQWKKQIEAFGYDKLGLGVPEANIVSKMTPEEIADAQKAYRENKTGLNLDPDTARKWTEFQQQLDFAGGQLQTVLAKGLVKLAPGLEHLSDAFVNLVESMLKDGSPIKGWIGSLGEGIKKFAEHMEDKTFQQHVSEFAKDSKNAIELIKTMVSNAPGGIAVLLAMYLTGKFLGSTATGLGAWLARIPGLPAAIAGGAVYETVKPQPLNEDEDERARQQKYGTTRNTPAGHRTQTPGTSSPPGAATTPGTRTDIQTTARTPGGDTGSDAGYGVGNPSALDVVHGSTEGVDKRLLRDVAAGAAHLPPGYKVKVFSGFRPGDRGAHGRGQAIDVEIVDPQGNVIPSRGSDRSGMYEKLARYAYGEVKARDPELAKNKFAWGGSFGTEKGGGGVSDLMHFDIMGRRGGIRPDHFRQVQDLGSIPLEKRTLSAYGAKPSHPATLGKAQQDIQVDNQAGSLVSVH